MSSEDIITSYMLKEILKRLLKATFFEPAFDFRGLDSFEVADKLYRELDHRLKNGHQILSSFHEVIVDESSLADSLRKNAILEMCAKIRNWIGSRHCIYNRSANTKFTFSLGQGTGIKDITEKEHKNDSVSCKIPKHM